MLRAASNVQASHSLPPTTSQPPLLGQLIYLFSAFMLGWMPGMTGLRRRRCWGFGEASAWLADCLLWFGNISGTGLWTFGCGRLELEVHTCMRCVFEWPPFWVSYQIQNARVGAHKTVYMNLSCSLDWTRVSPAHSRLLSTPTHIRRRTPLTWIMAYFMVMLALCVIVCQHNVPKPCERTTHHCEHREHVAERYTALGRSFDLILHIESETSEGFGSFTARCCVQIKRPPSHQSRTC